MKIAITGSNGLLGQKLSALLLEKNIPFLATGTGPNRFTQSAINYATVDISDPATYQAIIAFKPTHIIHAAAMTMVDDCETEKEKCTLLNETSVMYICNLANSLQAHLIHLSTDFIFDGTQEMLNEEAIPKPLSYYGNSKLNGEKIVQQNCNKYSIVRTVLVYGYTPTLARNNIVLWALDALKNNKEIKVVTDQFRTPTLAEDLAMGCYLIAKNNSEGIFNIAGKDYMSVYEMVQRIAKHTKLATNNVLPTDSSSYKPPAMRPPKTGLDIKKAEQILAYKAHSFEQGLELILKQMNP